MACIRESDVTHDSCATTSTAIQCAKHETKVNEGVIGVVKIYD
jgi:hypothetical protein